jgi:hypothetical protein
MIMMAEIYDLNSISRFEKTKSQFERGGNQEEREED